MPGEMWGGQQATLAGPDFDHIEDGERAQDRKLQV